MAQVNLMVEWRLTVGDYTEVKIQCNLLGFFRLGVCFFYKLALCEFLILILLELIELAQL